MKASKEKTGARALSEMLENTLWEANYKVLENPNMYSELYINKDTVLDNKNYVLKKSLHK